MTTELLKDCLEGLRDIDALELEGALDFFDHVSLAAGEELWSIGDRKKYVGFILKGKIVVKKPLDDSKQHVVLGVYGAGSIVGELSLLSDAPNALSAKALEPTDLVVIEDHKFVELLTRKPQVGLSLLKQLYFCTAKRLDKSYERMTSLF